MATGYVTFRGISAGRVMGFYRTQALANAAATDNTNVVAHVGAVELGELSPGGAYFDGTDVLEEIPLTALSDLARKKHALRTAHAYLRQLAVELAEEGVAHNIVEVHAAHNFPAFSHHGLYLVAHDDDYTDAQVIAFAEKVPEGPSDAATPYEWYTRIGDLHPVEGPSGPCVWVNPSDASRLSVLVTKDNAVDIFGDDTVTDTQLADGAWIEGLS